MSSSRATVSKPNALAPAPHEISKIIIIMSYSTAFCVSYKQSSELEIGLLNHCLIILNRNIIHFCSSIEDALLSFWISYITYLGLFHQNT
jgi:hypothetical protein